MKHEQAKPKDVLDQATASLRSQPVPEVPPEVLAAARAVSARARESSMQLNPRKGIPMKRIMKIAASLVVAAGLITLVGWLTIGPGGTTVAWADVQAQLRNVQTMSFDMAMQVPDGPSMEMRILFSEPGLMRQEMISPQATTNIMDFQKGVVMTIMPGQKKVMRITVAGLGELGRKRWDDMNWTKKLRQIVAENGTEIGRREIDGREAQGFHVVREGQNIDVWVDAQSGQMLEMMIEASGARMHMTNFRFNEPLEAALFSQEVPEGYGVQDMNMNITNPSAEDAARALEVWALARGGTFPDTLSPAQFSTDISRAAKGGAMPKEIEEKLVGPGTDKSEESKAMEMGALFGRAFVLFQNPRGHYAGAGVLLGAAETPIYWFRPEGSATYKVIYGDLRIADVAEADLPAKTATAPATAAAEDQ